MTQCGGSHSDESLRMFHYRVGRAGHDAAFCRKGEAHMEENVLLRMEGICKSFPGVKALDNAQLSVRAGTVHALMGENGAGKSTLMK